MLRNLLLAAIPRQSGHPYVKAISSRPRQLENQQKSQTINRPALISKICRCPFRWHEHYTIKGKESAPNDVCPTAEQATSIRVNIIKPFSPTLRNSLMEPEPTNRAAGCLCDYWEVESTKENENS